MGKLLFIIGLVIVLLCLSPLIVMWLWNGMLPDMFGFPEIGFWRALGLIILGNVLFGFKYTVKKDD